MVCDAASQVIAVVDVRAEEGKESSRARQRHARVDRVIAAANIPMHVWYEDALPTPAAARDLILAPAQAARRQPPPRPVPPRLNDPIEADAMLGAELEQRDPPPSTWFDNLDSAARAAGHRRPAPARRGGCAAAAQGLETAVSGERRDDLQRPGALAGQLSTRLRELARAEGLQVLELLAHAHEVHRDRAARARWPPAPRPSRCRRAS